MKITYFGTTTLLFDDGINQILFDGHFTRPSFFDIGFKKISTNKKLVDEMIQLHKIYRLKAIFVSHSHHDHVMDVPYIASRCGCDIYGSSSSLNVARGLSIDEAKLHEFECFKKINIGDFNITVIPSKHSKAHWYNNDLGQTIDSPLIQPAKKKMYKEGGSFDFIIEHQQKTYLIRPSYSYIEGQLDGIKADVLFLGVAGIAKASEEEKKMFFKETIEKVSPKLVIPVHWDNFFSSLEGPTIMMPRLFDNTEVTLYELKKYCELHGIAHFIQLPRSYINL